jgi:hypothetical protein
VKPQTIHLPEPDDSLAFFEVLKKESEKYWVDIVPSKGVYGFQVQPGTKWRPGLDEKQLRDFENAVGFSFPLPLRNFYRTMNGVTKPGINLYGSSGEPPAFHPVFYSYPEDMQVMRELIEWICNEMGVKKEDLESSGISRIFPVYMHRFLLIDIPGNPILSMYGSDIIPYAENLSRLLAQEIFDHVEFNNSAHEDQSGTLPEIRFWLDDDSDK